ncbi:serpentine type 7TM GPCR receptor class ab chemoreceptor domain-containing protein [Ditylenchus destructor]|uniref:Serpentine type 7TM GPCR receptor class ab chemoreceptor domain-containing protein n=1 Tax=Ditylenchus destructor TaxID=166010 RepID=A0AAD4QYB8_9BILA|nr:serpentine type 7TM GPCR receptor class ab chemoreceptor domain-containing protein [Ditylenchus destructor]
MTTNTSSLLAKCQNAELLAQSVFYKVVVAAKGSVNMAALVIFVFLAMSKAQIKIFHPNTKVILFAVCILEFLVALDQSCFYMFEMWRISYPYTDPCDRLWSAYILFVLRCFYLSCLNGINSSLVVLCIERVVCICRISNYEQSSKPWLVAAVLVAITLLFSVITTLLYLPGVEWSEGLVTTTAQNSKNAGSYRATLCYLFSIEMLALVCFLALHNWCLWYRKRIRGFKTLKQRNQPIHIQSSQSLSVKFQIEETIRTTSLFLPIVLVKCTCSALSDAAALVSSSIWPTLSIGNQMIMFEAVYINGTLPFFIVLLLIYGMGQMRQMFCCSKEHQSSQITILHSSQSQDEYFIRLKQMFETGASFNNTRRLSGFNWPRLSWNNQTANVHQR